jgi:hypothetical protein
MQDSGGVAEAKIVLRRAGPLLVDGGQTRLQAGVEVVELFEGVVAGEAAVMSLENNLSISDPVPLMAAIRD